MVLEIKDTSYFGHFNMDILKKMRSLRELEIITEQGEAIRGNAPGRYISLLTRDFEEARALDPGWECPRVSIVNGAVGTEVGLIPGGAVIPGWTGE